MAIYGPEEFRTESGKLLTLKSCGPEDVAAFLQFQPSVARETTHTLQVAGRVPDAARVLAAWEASLTDPIELRIGAFFEGRMVAQLGFHPLTPVPHPWTRHVGTFGMMVLQEFWGEGIGRRLLEVMERWALSIGVSRIEAHVRASNERGIRLYSRMGYLTEGRHVRAAFIDGAWQDEFFIAKILGQKTPELPTLGTERLILRPLLMGDAPAIFEYARNPNVSRYTLWEPHQSLKDSEAFILDYAFANYRRGSLEPLGLALKSDPGRIIGTVGCFWRSEPSRSMELAYAIGEPHWGQGLVAEAANAVILYAFSQLGANRIIARCKAENLASARVMQKIGMQFEGTLREDVFHRGRYWDMHHYAVLRNGAV